MSGLASMPLLDTRHPRTFPSCTLKMHFSGFRLRFAARRLAKVSARSVMWFSLLALVGGNHQPGGGMHPPNPS
jgi:multisubunit Na+/H+ antiporter MnhB subunit